MMPSTIFLLWLLAMGLWISPVMAFLFIRDARENPFLWIMSPVIGSICLLPWVLGATWFYNIYLVS